MYRCSTSCLGLYEMLIRKIVSEDAICELRCKQKYKFYLGEIGCENME